MTRLHRIRLVIAIISLLFVGAAAISQQPAPGQDSTGTLPDEVNQSIAQLESIAIKGKSPKTGYARTQFGNGWRTADGCDTRNIILARDLVKVSISSDCNVTSGMLQDPYTGRTIEFQRGSSTSSAVQIDHVVALSNAWQTGAQQISFGARQDLANDPLNLLAVDGPANQEKSDSDAATWLPSNKPFRCQYVIRQVSVKAKYHLWVTTAEKAAILQVLSRCT